MLGLGSPLGEHKGRENPINLLRPEIYIELTKQSEHQQASLSDLDAEEPVRDEHVGDDIEVSLRGRVKVPVSDSEEASVRPNRLRGVQVMRLLSSCHCLVFVLLAFAI